MQAFLFLKQLSLSLILTLFLLLTGNAVFGQSLVLNDSGYFEKPGVNVMIFSSQYNGMFFDEKTDGIELIHHVVRKLKTQCDDYAKQNPYGVPIDLELTINNSLCHSR